jgi:hypothetical protein
MKARLTAIRPVLLATATLMFALTGGCGGPSSGPEAQVREWLGVAQGAAEEKQRRKLMRMVSEGYLDGRGYSRDNVETMLIAYFLRQKSVKLVTSIEEVRVFGETAAEVDLTIGLAGSNDGVLGFSASAYNMSLELQQESGDWMLISARWGRVGEALE